MKDLRHFSTRTDQRWYATSTAAIGLSMGMAGSIFMWVWLNQLPPALFIFGITLLCNPILYFALRRQKNIPLHFYSNTLHIFCPDGMDYVVEDISRQAFRFYQNPLERKHNVGRIKIKGTQFYLYGVQNYAETRRYIRESIPDC